MDRPASDSSVDGGLVSFIDAIKLLLKQPLMVLPPRLRITKDPKAADDSDFVPKCSARLVAKSKFKATKPDVQARKVHLKKLGFEVVETEKPDETSFEEFQQTFTTPLPSGTQEAMEALFPGRGRRRATDVE
jgi:hypothetical protein